MNEMSHHSTWPRWSSSSGASRLRWGFSPGSRARICPSMIPISWRQPGTSICSIMTWSWSRRPASARFAIPSRGTASSASRASMTGRGWTRRCDRCRLGLDPIVDPIHHTSFPAWLGRGFLDDRFVESYAPSCWHLPSAILGCVATRRSTSRCLRPSSAPTMGSGNRTNGTSVTGCAWPATSRLRSRVSRLLKQVNPNIEIVHVDTCEAHHAMDEKSAPWARFLNERRFLLHDLILGRVDGPQALLVRRGARRSAQDGISQEDLDWLRRTLRRSTCWDWTTTRTPSSSFTSMALYPEPRALGFAEVARQYIEYFNLPVMLTETNIRGYVSDRLSWLKYMVEQSEQLVSQGVDWRGFCWFPFIDSTDWDSLLRCACNNLDPVGVYWLDDERKRHASEFSDLYAALAAAAHVPGPPRIPFSGAGEHRAGGLHAADATLGVAGAMSPSISCPATALQELLRVSHARLRHRHVGHGRLGPPRTAADTEDIAAIRAALDLGVRHIDTAEMYGGGHAEELVCQAIKGYDRRRLFSPQRRLHTGWAGKNCGAPRKRACGGSEPTTSTSTWSTTRAMRSRLRRRWREWTTSCGGA